MTDEKNFYTNNLAKAQKKGDPDEIAYWQGELDWYLAQKARARARGIRKPKVSKLNYEVKAGGLNKKRARNSPTLCFKWLTFLALAFNLAAAVAPYRFLFSHTSFFGS